MKKERENINKILSRYFAGQASEKESLEAENFLLAHPEIIDIFSKEHNLLLHAPDDICYNSSASLKTIQEYDEYQFQILCAAAAEGSLSPGMFSDFQSILECSPEKKAIASEFGKIRLKPLNEKWAYKNKLLHPAPALTITKRIIVISLAAAAILALVFSIKPLLLKNSQGPSSVILAENNNKTSLPVAASLSVFKKTEISVTKSDAVNKFPQKPAPLTTDMTRTDNYNIREDIISVEPAKILLPEFNEGSLTALAMSSKNVSGGVPPKESEDNWMINGIENIIRTVASETRKDSYSLAGDGIKGLNKILGWDMRLQKEKGKNGETKALVFQSGLLCFSTPVKNR